MKKSTLVFLSILGMTLTGCGNNIAPVDPSIDTYTVNYEFSSDFQITGLKDQYIEDEEVNFQVEVLNSLKELEAVKADEVTLTPVDSYYKFNMPTHNVTLTVLLRNKEISYINDIEFDMGTRTTSIAFKEGEEENIKETFVTRDGSINLIDSVSSFSGIYGGGYGGSGENKWIYGNALKFGTTSITGDLTLSLAYAVNKVTLSGFVGASTCRVQIGDADSTDWNEEEDDHKTTTVTCSDLATASKATIDNQDFRSIDVEFESTNSLKIAAINKKVFYLTSIRFYLGEQKTYTVTWKDDNGDILETDEGVIEGTVPYYDGEEPSKEGYDFIGWTPAVDKIYEDTIYTATYVEKGKRCTVSWQNYNGSVLETDEDLIPGSIPEYNGVLPEKTSDRSNEYIFIGWSPVVGQIYDDVIYTATYFAKDKSQQIAGFDPVKVGEEIEYGFYPQEMIKDIATIEALENAPSNLNNWYFYNNNFYYKQEANTFNGEAYTFDSGEPITNGHSYWFKCSPIKWNILITSGNNYTVISNKLLDNNLFYSDLEDRIIKEETIHPNNYLYSDIRTFLNEDFLDLAFFTDSSNLLEIEVGTGQVDKITLPTLEEMNTLFDNDLAREALTSDYARSVGAFANKRDASHKNNGTYWTRSASSIYSYASYNVNSGGVLSEYAVDGASHCIRPLIKINIA